MQALEEVALSLIPNWFNPKPRRKDATQAKETHITLLAGFPIKSITADHAFWSSCNPIQLPILHQTEVYKWFFMSLWTHEIRLKSMSLISEDSCVTYNFEN